MVDYLDKNRAHWNESTECHWRSSFYDVEGWLAGADSLKEPELALLPVSLDGLRVLHLQCHFGQDTLSLARRGARVTGVDFSDVAIERARELAARAGLEASFVCCDVFELPTNLDAASDFDVVFTSYGTIGWLPRLDRWAEVVAHFLRPGGSFVFAEFHPVVWMLDETHREFEYSYFNRGPIEEESVQSYTGATRAKTITVGWNHTIADVVCALLDEGLQLEALHEHDYSPWACFADAVAVGPDRFQLEGLEGKLPLSYALRARK